MDNPIYSIAWGKDFLKQSLPPPQVRLSPARGALIQPPFLVIIEDLDAPMGNAPFLHYLAVYGGARTAPYPIVPFMPAQPPQGTGVHRYVTRVFTRLDDHATFPVVPSSRTAFYFDEREHGWGMLAMRLDLLGFDNTPPPSRHLTDAAAAGREGTLGSRPTPSSSAASSVVPPKSSKRGIETTAGGRLSLIPIAKLVAPDDRIVDLTTKQEAVCRCVAHVGAQMGPNPYAVCQKSVKTTYPRGQCGARMDYPGLTADERRGWLYWHLNKSNTSSNVKRILSEGSDDEVDEELKQVVCKDPLTRKVNPYCANSKQQK